MLYGPIFFPIVSFSKSFSSIFSPVSVGYATYKSLFIIFIKPPAAAAISSKMSLYVKSVNSAYLSSVITLLAFAKSVVFKVHPNFLHIALNRSKIVTVPVE